MQHCAWLILAAGLTAAAAYADDGSAAHSGPIVAQSYEKLAQTLAGRISFEELPTLPEPGASYDQLLTAPSVSIGAALSGQIRRSIDGHDTLLGAPSVPLQAILDPPGQNLAVAYHVGLGSNALFPLGPNGFRHVSGRGEGAIALVFTHDVNRFALKLHADYADPLGHRPHPGPVTLSFYDVAGALIAAPVLHPDHGVVRYGFQLSQPARAVTLTHQDPGGIAVDDILYPLDSYSS